MKVGRKREHEADAAELEQHQRDAIHSLDPPRIVHVTQAAAQVADAGLQNVLGRVAR